MNRGAVNVGADPLAGASAAGATVSPRARRAVPIRLALAAVLLLVLWAYTPPAEPPWRVCGFHWLTGRPCPLCGLTRAMFALAKGHWGEAIGFNVLSPLGLVMLFGLFWDGPVRGRLWTGGIAGFAAYGVVRIFIAGA
ncbi:MAG: DUF2752 domain-containing protein [Acidobacteriia bacterium]|nr:DUF2752 domain-containing protein [Terriglobia bacterium]